jgi:hypothetical protein
MAKRLALVLLPAMALSACLQSTTVVKVNADGSGTLENQTLMSAAALAQVRQLSGAFGGAEAKAPELFSEQQARAMAAQMGEGVSLVSTMPVTAAGSEGRASVYAFRDITKLRVSQTPPTPGDASIRAGGLGVGGAGRESPVTIDLSRTPAGTMLLTLHTASDPLTSLLGQSGALNRRGGQSPIDQLAMMRQMLAGMHVALRVEPAGRVVHSNSPFVDGQTVTLFDVDVDALLNNEQALQQLGTARTPAETAEVLKAVPGIKIAPERDITIEFAP